ncbi:MAG: HNH endonuclease [Planctomycetota bacterium]
MLDSPSLVLNRSWMPVHVTTVRRALTMVFAEQARAIDPGDLQTHDFESWWALGPCSSDRVIVSTSGPLRPPEVVQLARFDKVPTFRTPFSRAGLFRRDDYQCQYCGAKPEPSKLTVDHVVPRSRGGTTGWDNCAVACRRCNSAKGNHDLATVGMKLRKPLSTPKSTLGLPGFTTVSLESWRQFLPNSGRRTGA